jgi:hypothetical protein
MKHFISKFQTCDMSRVFLEDMKSKKSCGVKKCFEKQKIKKGIFGS